MNVLSKLSVKQAAIFDFNADLEKNLLQKKIIIMA